MHARSRVCVLLSDAIEAIGEAKAKEFVARCQPGVFEYDEERKQVSHRAPPRDALAPPPCYHH